MLSKELNGHGGDKGGWTKIDRRKDRSITSFYVSNIQQDTTVEMMRSAFQPFGKIADIYIPGRKDKGGSYFAFVKYQGVKNAEELVSYLNRVKCGNCITRVNVARYEKNVVKKVAPVYDGSRKFVKQATNHQWKTRDGRSFAEAVSGKKNEETPTILLRKAPAMNFDDSSLIGEVLSLQHLKDIPKLLHADGRIPCELYFAGGLKVVLKFSFSKTAEAYLKSEQGWNRWFKWLKLGISEEVDFDRLAWVRLHGLPIHLRSLENITSVVGSIGKVLEVGGYNWANADLTTSTARILTTSKLSINDVVNCAYNGKMYKVGVVECAEAWDPISSYYEGSELNSDNEDMDINDKDEQDDDGSDDDANSEAWRNDVEEGEIIAESNNNEFPVGDPPATIPVSLEKVNPNPNNSLFNVVDERLHGEENVDYSTRPNMGANFEACGATSGDSLGVKLPDPVNIPLPDSPIQPTEPICTYKTSGFEWNIPGPINSMAATELNEISRSNLGNSSKRRKLNKSSRSSVSVNVHPRNLVDDFDLNVAIPSHSDSSNRLDCSSSSSIEVEKIIQIGNQVGFKVDDAGSHRIVDEVLGNIPSGEGAIDGHQ
ncbi:hypothetical protein L2E82_44129 [Cichorium intybus]|uniref:Uncharacterized protein n=1 Tax=Cichorium intybus TaxID=13427 RepID=A0ACB8ZQD7_CICIN|nr:hypothetical protein L2E82_44129 [Cichorium intybus]